MEPNEIPEFTKTLEESTQAGEQGASLTNISLAISILAVLVAMVTVLGHRSHTQAILAQARTGDQWSEYQTKRIRSDQADLAIELLSVEETKDPVATQKKIADNIAHQAKWKDDLLVEQKAARAFQAEADHAETQAGRLDLGEALLQIGVVLCSITLFTRHWRYFYLGLLLGVCGSCVSISAWFVR